MITSALEAQMLVNPSQELLMSLPRKLKHSINISVTDGDTRYLESFSGYSINIKGNGNWVIRDVEDDKKILEIIKNRKSIIILNKIDINKKIQKNDQMLTSVSKKIIEISALKKQGIENLYNTISEMFDLNEINLDNEVLITNIRHKDLINKAIEKIQETKDTIKRNMPIDIIAIYIKDILEALGSITGEEVSEDIINEIFSKFCLGK